MGSTHKHKTGGSKTIIGFCNAGNGNQVSISGIVNVNYYTSTGSTRFDKFVRLDNFIEIESMGDTVCRYARSYRRDNTGTIAVRNDKTFIELCGGASGALFHLRRIDATGFNANQHLCVAGIWF